MDKTQSGKDKTVTLPLSHTHIASPASISTFLYLLILSLSLRSQIPIFLPPPLEISPLFLGKIFIFLASVSIFCRISKIILSLLFIESNVISRNSPPFSALELRKSSKSR